MSRSTPGPTTSIWSPRPRSISPSLRPAKRRRSGVTEPYEPAAVLILLARLCLRNLTPMTELRPPLPPFSLDTANQKVRAAEDAWNSRDPSVVSRSYSLDSKWRHRTEFLQGRAQIETFLANKWTRANEYRLVK